jgi:4-diphosphocytidyl-2-C-methyl-D-erythritol kinase
MVSVSAPAKVNLFLRILAREDSGYHQIETLFAALEFGDEVTVSLSGEGISLAVDGPHLGPDEENLAYRAAEEFLRCAGREVGIQIQLAKRIPPRGGLGGGSSDAGAVLRALDALLPGWVSPGDLHEVANRLGSDVAFFLSPSPLALAWGRGDRILALPPLPRVPVVLSIPPVGVSTPEAYRMLGEGTTPGGPTPATAAWAVEDFSSWQRVGEKAHNDFEGVVVAGHPLLAPLRRALAESGPILSLLSGSGATLFAIFETDDLAEAAIDQLVPDFPETRFVLTHTLTQVEDPSPVPGVEG